MTRFADTFDAQDTTLILVPEVRRRAPEQVKLATWARAYDAAMDRDDADLAYRLACALRALTPDWWLHVRHPTQDDERPGCEAGSGAHASHPDPDDTLEIAPTDEVELDGQGYEEAFFTDGEFERLLAAYKAAQAARDTQTSYALAE